MSSPIHFMQNQMNAHQFPLSPNQAYVQHTDIDFLLLMATTEQLEKSPAYRDFKKKTETLATELHETREKLNQLEKEHLSLQTKHDVLKECWEQALKAMSASNAHPSGLVFAPELPQLKEEDYNTNFWHEATWTKHEQKKKKTTPAKKVQGRKRNDEEEDPDNATYPWLEDENSNPVCASQRSKMSTKLNRLLESLFLAGLATPSYSNLSETAMNYVKRGLASEFIVFRLCSGNWKQEMFIKTRYSWWSRYKEELNSSRKIRSSKKRKTSPSDSGEPEEDMTSPSASDMSTTTLSISPTLDQTDPDNEAPPTRATSPNTMELDDEPHPPTPPLGAAPSVEAPPIRATSPNAMDIDVEPHSPTPPLDAATPVEDLNGQQLGGESNEDGGNSEREKEGVKRIEDPFDDPSLYANLDQSLTNPPKTSQIAPVGSPPLASALPLPTSSSNSTTLNTQPRARKVVKITENYTKRAYAIKFWVLQMKDKGVSGPLEADFKKWYADTTNVEIIEAMGRKALEDKQSKTTWTVSIDA